MKFLDAFNAVSGLFDNVKTVVQTVETEAQATGLTAGSAKYANAVAKVNAALAIADEYKALATMLEPVVGPLVDAAVAWLNATGIFSHKAAAPVAAPVAPAAPAAPAPATGS